jgi:hypothetical protein
MAKIDDLLIKYPSVRKTTAKIFNECDKTPTKKYLEYLFKYWVNTPTYNKVSARELCEVVMDFETLLPYIENKDIYHKEYTRLNQVVTIVDRAKKLKEEKTFVREEHVEVLIENDDYILLRPLTLKGSMKYGAGTRWCTTSPNGRHFSDYTKRGFLYYLVSKKERNKGYNKIAFNINSRKDTMIDKVNIYNETDSLIVETTILNNKWLSFEFFEIIMKIRAHAFETSILEKTKNDVDNVITKLKSIDLDSFFKNIEFVNNYDNSGSEYKEKLNNLLDKLTEKMK